MKLPRSVITIGCFVVFSAGGYFLSTKLQPQNTAYAGNCVGRVDGALTNVCDKDIVMALCRDNGRYDHQDDVCVTEMLAPNAAISATLDVEGTGRPYTMACDAPFVPAWKHSNSNANVYRKGCRKPD